MTTIARTAPAVRTSSRTLWPLARLEALRYARHPLFLVGLVLGIVTSAGERGPIELDYHVIPSFFIGVFGIIVAARLTATTRRSQTVLDAAPVSSTTRTAACCLACGVPAAAGVVLVLVHRIFVLSDPIPDWQYGTYGGLDRVAITILVPVIACAGGPLLGVLVARWMRFTGAALITVVAVLLWSELTAYLPPKSSLDPASPFARTLHMVTPYTAFGQRNDDSTTPLRFVQSYTGSPIWFAVWTLALCGLAVTAAMWPGARGRARGLVGRTFVIVAVCASAALTLAIVTGNAQLYETVRGG